MIAQSVQRRSHRMQALARTPSICHSTRAFSVAPSRQELVMDTKTLLIIVLAVGVAVLGYLYYESQQNKVRVDLPGVKIEAN
jgi:malic enzyme